MADYMMRARHFRAWITRQLPLYGWHVKYSLSYRRCEARPHGRMLTADYSLLGISSMRREPHAAMNLLPLAEGRNFFATRRFIRLPPIWLAECLRVSAIPRRHARRAADATEMRRFRYRRLLSLARRRGPRAASLSSARAALAFVAAAVYRHGYRALADICYALPILILILSAQPAITATRFCRFSFRLFYERPPRDYFPRHE